MIPLLIVRRSLLAAILAGLFALRASAQDSTPPVIVNPVGDLNLAANSAPTTINLKKTFGLTGVTGKLVRFTTNLGKIDIELLSDAAPNTVANFLAYVDAGSYTNTIFHRSTTLATDGLAIIQGGETTLLGNTISTITTFGNVNNEYSLPDSRGTIAMAKQADSPDSASDQWFFNVSDNSTVLNASNNGGFTVFGRVIERDLETMDAIASLPTQDFSTTIRNDWTNLPVYNYDASQGLMASNVVVASSIAELPLVSKGDGSPGAIKLKLKSNSNPGLVDVQLKGRKLVLTPAAGQTGTAAITLQAKGAPHSKITYTFNVNVK